MINYVRTGMPDAYERKRRRVYGRILSGVVFARTHHQQLYFLTLTKSTLSGIYTITESFNLLVKIIRKKYGFFEYAYIRTEEGNGVLHVLFKSRVRISIDFIRMYWDHFAHSNIMRIEKSYGTLNQLTNYLVGYLTKNIICHFVMSTHWIFPQWTIYFNDYIHDKKYAYYVRVKRWNDFLRKYDTKTLYSQKYLKKTDLLGHFHANRTTDRIFSIAVGLQKNRKTSSSRLGLSGCT